MMDRLKAALLKPYAWPMIGWIACFFVLSSKGSNVDFAMFAAPIFPLLFAAFEWHLRRAEQFNDFRFRPQLQKACIALPLAVLVMIGIQNQITLYQVESHLQKGEYDQASQILNDRLKVAFHSEMALRLAHIYATTPQLQNRNYEKSIELSQRLLGWHNPVLDRLASDAYACALFASRRENEAKAFAETQGLNKRLARFKVGRPCAAGDDITFYSRNIASDN